MIKVLCDAKYRELKKEFKKNNTYNFVDLYINENTRKVFINNRGLLNNIATSLNFSFRKYHLYDFSEIDSDYASFDRDGNIIRSITFTIEFTDGYRYFFPILELPTADNSIEARAGMQVVQQLKSIFVPLVVKNAMRRGGLIDGI